jgi:uncharacterized protein (DUF1778 family)
MKKAAKEDRIETRCTYEQKQMLRYAADLCGQNLTEFTLSALMEKATAVIKDHTLLEISMRDQMAFAEAIINPREANENLLKAKDRHLKEVNSK